MKPTIHAKRIQFFAERENERAIKSDKVFFCKVYLALEFLRDKITASIESRYGWDLICPPLGVGF